MKKPENIRFIAQAAIIASMYVALTYLFAPISSGLMQVRISEALTVLPYFTPAAIPGLFVGCLISNIIVGNGAIDIIFGSLATLVAAFLSYKMPRRWLVPLPSVVVNAIVVGYILHVVLEIPFFVTMGWVALGQTISCYLLGYILMLALERHKDRVFF